MSQKVVLGLVQMSMSGDKSENMAKAEHYVLEAAKRGAQIVCLPELFSTPYFCREEHGSDASAEAVPGPTSQQLSKLAKAGGVVLVGGSIWERAPSGLFNTSCVYGADGEMLGTYRKVHIPHDPLFYEQNYFKPGDLGFKVWKTPFGTVAVLICYDQWFPEAARAVSLMGADVVFYPTAIGTAMHVEESEGQWQSAWETVQCGHAIANGMVVAAVNRVGIEGQLSFWGGSFVCDAFGNVRARAGREEEIVTTEVHFDHGRKVKEGWRFFYNRRPEMYGVLVGQKLCSADS